MLVIDSLEIGGAERHVTDLAIALRGDGYDVTVACSAGGPLAREITDAGIPVHVLMFEVVKRRVSLEYARQLRQLLSAGPVDLVHAHVYASQVAAALAVRGTGIPLVLTEHSDGHWKGRPARVISRWSRNRAADVIAVSESVAGSVRASGIREQRVRVIPNAVPPSGIIGEAPREPRGSGRHLVGVVARLQPEKGIDIFLQAAAQVVEYCPGSRFLIVGDGPERVPLQEMAVRLGLGDRTRFLDSVSSGRSILPFLDVLAVPSRTEGAPLAVLEAMAAGVPIVASLVGGIPEQVRDGREALLVAPGNATELARTIVRVLCDRPLAGRLASAAKVRVDAYFSYPAMLRQIEDLYTVRAPNG
jgi:glycosyltransferase involved in cell wall biosynthesis